ncbi:hypothetical protein B0J13DRAFT_47783 [Dactylonectria estremocensis]|uniref:Uncharacterized protein n=1 Tax=Dactylonectria estremocensis TaxID=1079267 RepID=A0A9P9J7I8_9HYPO|nr:hypothetical protein B0J13DRAFT_47783 [Dactylonectria estremocensis]
MSQKMKDMMQKGKDMGKEKGTQLRGVKPKGTIRGKAAGLVGMQRKNSDDSENHVARPISQLRDPGEFAPPPKRTGSGLLPAPPPTKAAPRKVIMAPSKYQDPRAAPVETPVYQKQLTDSAYHEEEPQYEDEHRPPQPYRVNTTGLATDNLPPPPGRRDGADGRGPPPLPPPSYQAATTGSKPPPPSLPPRLPPRSNSGSSTASAPPAVGPASTGGGYLNQGALSRLGAAGVSVPGFGIGRSSSPANQSNQSPPQPPRPGATPAVPSHMNEVQNRFSRLGTSSTPPATTTPPPPPNEGTTWAQKQAAMKTASAFHKDPSSVSFSDAKAAAGTANNFRQRHGEQVASGFKTANGLNQKYGLADKVGSYTGSHHEQSQGQGAAAPSPLVPGLAGKKKPPPPPPPKKRAGLGHAPAASSAVAGDAPPPVPMSTRPQF